MSIDEGRTLLALARAAITTRLGHPMAPPQAVDWLQATAATFVTLMQQGNLRGCIGTLEPHRSLLADVQANAVAAALRDPRFAPLTLAELDHTEVEVSVLSPTERLQFNDEAEARAVLHPGTDGVVLSFRHFRSTFLPQVWEQLPTTGEFLAQLKRKAGLPADFWHDDVQLSRYTVQKWKDSDFADAATPHSGAQHA